MNAIDRAYDAYRSENTAVKTLAAIEYEAFLRVTRRLALIDDPRMPFAQVAQAIYENRRLWIFLASAAADPENKLPAMLRSRILSLADFVGRHSAKVLNGSVSKDILVEINLAIMQGLRAQDNKS